MVKRELTDKTDSDSADNVSDRSVRDAIYNRQEHSSSVEALNSCKVKWKHSVDLTHKRPEPVTNGPHATKVHANETSSHRIRSVIEQHTEG